MCFESNNPVVTEFEGNTVVLVYRAGAESHGGGVLSPSTLWFTMLPVHQVYLTGRAQGKACKARVWFSESPISNENTVKGPLYSLRIPHSPLSNPSLHLSLLWGALSD